ncbi:MAG TPA: methylated-DNA--[protein]-cysteine S-methyltransferase [Oceanipulchritudo sp.]|nr:methylated-DNA--[protein]-cysteine S-methyltransferase [Oceanipulchritudo sp.]
MSSPRKDSGELVLYPVETPAGLGWLGMAGKRICWLSIGKLDQPEVERYWKGPVVRATTCPVSTADLQRAASGKGKLKLDPRGTPFQQQVWQELLRIPFSTTARYGDLAARLGSPNKARAVGTAVGANPIAWLIPCHRVLPASGGMGGYRWGVRAKERLLAWERNGQPSPAPTQDAEDKRKLEAMLLNAQRFEDIAKLAGHIAHDLNNLLAPIRMATELLKRKLEDRSVDRYVEIIENSTGRARSVIQEILTFSRESEGNERQVINVNSLLAELEKMARETFPESVKLTFSYQPDAPAVEIDPHQLHRSILNLLVNARDAINDSGSIKVRISTHDVEMRICVGERCLVPGRYVCISVTDNGCGIPADIRDKIFDPFFTTKPKEKGTGLGLASVFGIVARAGGFIDLESIEGKGTTFHLFLPEA